MFEITTVGLDLAKNVFQAHGADVSGGGHIIKAAAGPIEQHHEECDTSWHAQHF